MDANKVAIPGGFLIRTDKGKYCPASFRDFASAMAFVRLHPYASLTHLTRPWAIERAADGVTVAGGLKPRQVQQ